MDIFNQVIKWLESLAVQIPLPLFTILGGFIEEVLAPIPSPFVMMLAGSIAKSQNYTIPALILVSAIGALGKGLGAWLLYIIGDKAEDFALGKFGKFIGIEQKDVESIGGYFKGGAKDWIIMIVMRAIPIMPTSPLSLIAGVIKIDLKAYLIGGYIGTVIRNFFFIYLGYLGLDTANSIMSGLDSAESIAKVIFVAVVGAGLAFLYYKRSKKNPMDWMKKNKTK
jgi:membrane protein DedA with SNARE-associated domain